MFSGPLALKHKTKLLKMKIRPITQKNFAHRSTIFYSMLPYYFKVENYCVRLIVGKKKINQNFICSKQFHHQQTLYKCGVSTAPKCLIFLQSFDFLSALLHSWYKIHIFPIFWKFFSVAHHSKGGRMSKRSNPSPLLTDPL